MCKKKFQIYTQIYIYYNRSLNKICVVNAIQEKVVRAHPSLRRQIFVYLFYVDDVDDDDDDHY